MATTPAQAKGMSDIDPRPPFPFSLGLGSITYSRVLASERYRLTLNSQVGSTATRGSWRISPGVSPEFACTLYVEDLATGSSVRLSETDPAASERWTPGSIIRQWQALDAQVMQELAYHGRPLARRDSEAARVSVELEELYARHAKERRAVRRLLLDSGSAGTGADS